jgi:hypothetical protein
MQISLVHSIKWLENSNKFATIVYIQICIAADTVRQFHICLGLKIFYDAAESNAALSRTLVK